jgi:hypothetical protein
LRLQIRDARADPRRGLISRAGLILRIVRVGRIAVGPTAVGRFAVRPTVVANAAVAIAVVAACAAVATGATVATGASARGSATAGRVKPPGSTPKLKRKLQRRQRALVQPFTRNHILRIDRQLLKRNDLPIPADRPADLVDDLLRRQR